MPDTTKFLSIFNVGGVNYNLKDAAATQKLAKMLGEHAVEKLGAAAWEAVASEVKEGATGLPTASAVKSYVDSMIETIPEFDVVVVADSDDLPAASADTFHKIYLKKDAHAVAGNSYDEYITIRSGSEGNYTYSWEKVGSTDIDISGKVDKTTTIAGIALDHNITAAELKTALGLKAFAYAAKGTATVAAKTVSGVKATGTSTGSLTGDVAYDKTAITSTGTVTIEGSVTGDAIKGGSIDVTLKDAATASEATVIATAYKPAGTVATTFTAAAEGAQDAISFGGDVSKPTATVTSSTATIKGMKTSGTAYSITNGSVSQAADTKSAFATEGVTASVTGETLTFAAATTSQAVTAAGAVTYRAPVLSGALPTFDEGTSVMTGATVEVSKPTFTPDKYSVSSSFEGEEEANMKVNKVTYVKQAIDQADFKPVAAQLGFSADEATISVSGKYDKANKGTLAFAGDDIELAVGDIAVPEQTITVNPVTE